MSLHAASAQEITNKAKSNLAFALQGLPRQNREDMIVFYAFCRLIDDIADDDNEDLELRKEKLLHIKAVIREEVPSDVPLWNQLLKVKRSYHIPTDHLSGIIDGMIQDLHPIPFDTIEEVLDYCYKVACLVGLVSVRIFGCTHAQSEAYAIHLGYALQLTNIIRDAGEDYQQRQRIYFAQEDLQTFQVTPSHFEFTSTSTELHFLLEKYAKLALHYYQSAHDCITKQDFQALVAARTMAETYKTLLHDIIQQGFPVLKQRQTLSKFHKALILLRQSFIHYRQPSTDLNLA